MYCMHCGEQIADSSRYCKYCGEFVAENQIINDNETYTDKDIIETPDISEEVENVNEVIYSAPVEEEKEEIIDDIFFEHLSTKKKVGLFFAAVFMIAIVAVIVFALFFPELI